MNNLFEELYDNIYLVESAKDMKVRYIARFKTEHPEATDEDITTFTKEVEKYLKLFDPIRKQPPHQLMDNVDIYVEIKDVDEKGRAKYDDNGNLIYVLKPLPKNEIFRKNIDNYRNFDALKKMVDYIASQRDITPKSKTSAEKVIFEDNHLKIWSGQTQEECVAAKLAMPIPYEWCIARPDALNIFNNYRYSEGGHGHSFESVFYFVQNKAKTKKELAHWENIPDSEKFDANKPLASKILDKWHQIVIQVLATADPKSLTKSTGQYVLSNAHNDREVPTSWTTILKYVPELDGHQELFQPIPLTDEQRNTYATFSQRINEYMFSAYSFSERKLYIDFYVGGYDASRVLSNDQFKNCAEELQNQYINKGVGLTQEQYDEIQNNQMLVRRYSVLSNRQADLFIQAPDANVRFVPTQLEMLGKEKRVKIFKYYTHFQLNYLIGLFSKPKDFDLKFKYAMEIIETQKNTMNHYIVSTIIHHATIIYNSYHNYYNLDKSEELIETILNNYTVDQLNVVLPDLPIEQGYNQNSMLQYFSSFCEKLTGYMVDDDSKPYSTTKTAVTISRILQKIQKKFEDANQVLPTTFVTNLLVRLKGFNKLAQQLQGFIVNMVKQAETNDDITPANLIGLLSYLENDAQRIKIGEKILKKSRPSELDTEQISIILRSFSTSEAKNAFSIKIAKHLESNLNYEFLSILLETCAGANHKELLDVILATNIPLTPNILSIFNVYNRNLKLEDAKVYFNKIFTKLEKPFNTTIIDQLYRIYKTNEQAKQKEWLSYIMPKIIENLDTVKILTQHEGLEILFQSWTTMGVPILDAISPILQTAFTSGQKINKNMIIYPLYYAAQRSKPLAEQLAFQIIDLMKTKLTYEYVQAFEYAASVKVKKKLIDTKCANGPLDNQFIMAIFRDNDYPKTLLRAVLKCRPDLQGQHPFNTVTPEGPDEVEESVNILENVYDTLFKPTGIRLD